jgi:hypothetical protein
LKTTLRKARHVFSHLHRVLASSPAKTIIFWRISWGKGVNKSVMGVHDFISLRLWLWNGFDLEISWIFDENHLFLLQAWQFCHFFQDLSRQLTLFSLRREATAAVGILLALLPGQTK